MRLPIQISEHSREPIYHQIEQQLISIIVSGQLKAGTPLPSIRALALDLSCSVITTRRAYQNLEQQHYIKTIQGKGTFVAEIKIEKKEDIAQSTLYQAFRKALEMSFRMNNSIEQANEIYEQVLKDILEERERTNEKY